MIQHQNSHFKSDQKRSINNVPGLPTGGLEKLDRKILKKLVQYQNIIQFGKQLLAELEGDRVLKVAIDGLVHISGAERGILILFDDDKDIVFETARNLNRPGMEIPKSEVSRMIINKVKNKGLPVCLKSAYEDPQLRKNSNIARLKIFCAICLPLKKENEIFGVIYLDNRTAREIFTDQTYEFITDYSDFISLAAYNTLKREQQQSKMNSLEGELRTKYHFESIIGQHPKMIEILQLITQIADTDATVLIQGESGTGKELIARALHFNSGRKEKPFVPINCGALPENLLESELFGHVRGAFTGAVNDKAGWFECADGGTIFLDEVSEMSPGLQVKLLRILQTGEYSRVGDTRLLHCDVRIIAATNKDLPLLVKQTTFREDLYYRLNVIDLVIPPLRERKSDIPLLMQHFLKIYGHKYNKNDLQITDDAETIVLAYDFPGNCRELENIIQHAVLLCSGKYIQPAHLPPKLGSQYSNSSASETLSSFKLSKKGVIEKFERDYLIDCLKANKGHIRNAAKTAGINIKNFYHKMKKYSIDPHFYKLSRIK